MLTETPQTQKSTYSMIHLNEIREQEKLIVGGKNLNNGCLGMGRKSKSCWDGVWGNFSGVVILILMHLLRLPKCA